MKVIGTILIGIGILDFALSWISDDWNLFVYNLVGEDMMQFTAIILVVIGSVISRMGGGDEVHEE
tara:strand:+ start:505 stop:699 length:195 start_codon:yes stop_codon:yes gene_type:complete